jgi:hypothetical protein
MQHLCRALIWNACFFELSDEETLPLDVAVAQLESIASHLQAATTEEKAAFVASCQNEAHRLRAEGSPTYAAALSVIEALPERLGLK